MKELLANPEINTFLDVYIGHLTLQEQDIFDNSHLWTTYSYTEGIWVRIPRVDEDELREELEPLNLEEQTVELMVWAAKKGISFIRFDMDGVIYPELLTRGSRKT